MASSSRTKALCETKTWSAPQKVNRMKIVEDGKVTRLYLVLNGIRPENPVQTGMEVHPNCNSSILGIHQSAQIVAVNVTYQQVSAVRKDQGWDSICKGSKKHGSSLHHLDVNAIQKNIYWELSNILGLSR